MNRACLLFAFVLFSFSNLWAEERPSVDNRKQNVFGTYIFDYLWFLNGENGETTATVYWRNPPSSPNRLREYSVVFDRKNRIEQIGYYMDGTPSFLERYTYDNKSITMKGIYANEEEKTSTYNLMSSGGFYAKTEEPSGTTTGELIIFIQHVFIWMRTSPTTGEYLSRGDLLTVSDEFLPISRTVETGDNSLNHKFNWMWEDGFLREIVDKSGNSINSRMVFSYDNHGRIAVIQFFDHNDIFYGLEEIEYQ